MPFIDGFVASVPHADKQAFIDHAAHFAKYFKKKGALRVVDCWGSDVPDGKLTSFPMAVQCAEGETVVFSWIEWPDKETRDACHAGMESDPEMAEAGRDMPFDGKRMIYGGFEQVLDA
jgi:uncharacterized protein YbaA (DUF1428 family)